MKSRRWRKKQRGKQPRLPQKDDMTRMQIIMKTGTMTIGMTTREATRWGHFLRFWCRKSKRQFLLCLRLLLRQWSWGINNKEMFRRNTRCWWTFGMVLATFLLPRTYFVQPHDSSTCIVWSQKRRLNYVVSNLFAVPKVFLSRSAFPCRVHNLLLFALRWLKNSLFYTQRKMRCPRAISVTVLLTRIIARQ